MARPNRTISSNTLGEYLRSLRQQRGLTIRKLSIQIDRTDAYINRLELGKRGTDLASLYKLVVAVGGDFRYAVACLCRDEGVPDEEVARIAQGSTGQSRISKASSSPKPKPEVSARKG